MKAFKKIISGILALALLVSSLPIIAFADGETAESTEEYRISNQYMSFGFNKKTGGFAIETAEGNPKKKLDDNIPLLYSEDKERSNGTSFITVRIDGKDYIFGQDYGFFGLDSSMGDIVVSEDGRRIDIPWTIKNIKVVLTAALSNNDDTDTTGNVGLSFKVINESDTDSNVGIRILLDTAVGNTIDAPYFVVDAKSEATLCETEYSGDDVPQQIRAVDSLTDPSRLAYILTKAEGWSGGQKPSRVIVGHWANLANTRYDYDPDPYCDFTNYSNTYRVPDSAAALYWDSRTVAKSGGAYSAELLYGVGNFSSTASKAPMWISISRRKELSLSMQLLMKRRTKTMVSLM